MKINWFLLVTTLICGGIMLAPLVALYLVIIRV